jgi:predicted transcriptional regulator
MDKNKIKTSFTLSPKVKHLIDILSKKMEISKTAIVTLAILYFAEKEGASVDEDNETG